MTGSAAIGVLPAHAVRRSTRAPSTTRGRTPRPLSRTWLRYVLGALWLLDGLLQLQPAMFRASFATDILMPAADGQPRVVSGPLTFAAQQVLVHPVVWNAGFAAIQVLLGLLLLLAHRGRTVRLVLLASILWSVAVWWLGEGIGGLLGGHTSLLLGAPGAVILYAVLAAAAWPSTKTAQRALPPVWTRWAWLVVWAGVGLLELATLRPFATSFGDQLRDVAQAVPGPLASVDLWAAGMLDRGGSTGFVLLTLIEVAIGLGVLVAALRTAAVAVGIVLATVYWATGQAFGQLASGQATDPNTGPLLALLGFTVLAAARRQAVTSSDRPALSSHRGGRHRRP